VALAQDAIELADRLALDRLAIVGHDWGARAACTVAALFPERTASIAAMALGPHNRAALRLPRSMKRVLLDAVRHVAVTRTLAAPPVTYNHC
jgi:pimeloyl-ACP methyl ester carboxylesterase